MLFHFLLISFIYFCVDIWRDLLSQLNFLLFFLPPPLSLSLFFWLWFFSFIAPFSCSLYFKSDFLYFIVFLLSVALFRLVCGEEGSSLLSFASLFIVCWPDRKFIHVKFNWKMMMMKIYPSVEHYTRCDHLTTSFVEFMCVAVWHFWLIVAHKGSTFVVNDQPNACVYS